MCPRSALALPALALVLSGCAVQPYVAPSAAGKPGSEVAKLVASSEATYFGCNIADVKGTGGTDSVELGGWKPEVTLLPGHYDVGLRCTNGLHVYEPRVAVNIRAGKGYTLTGYFIDDSITIFTMRMRVRVAELP